jgi:hypothetical protein
MQEPNPPRTAKEAALQGAKADKPPFNPQADRRHVIASLIRRAGEITGQSDEPADAAGDGPSAEPTFDTVGDQQSFGNLDEGPVNSGQAGDMTLAQIVAADQAAFQDFSMPPATPDEGGPPPALGSSMDALQTRSWSAGAFDAEVDTLGSQPTLPELAGFIDASRSPDTAPSNPLHVTPDAFPSLESFQFNASALENVNSPTPDSAPSDPSDLFFQHDTAAPGGMNQLSDNPAGDTIGPKIQMLSSGASAADARPTGEDLAPIAYRPFGQPAPAQNAEIAPREKRRFEFESSIAESQRDSVLSFTAMEAAFIKLVEHMGEQDRRDAFALAASRRACL